MKNLVTIGINTFILLSIFFWGPNLFFNRNGSGNSHQLSYDENFQYHHLGPDLVKRTPKKESAGISDDVGYFYFRNQSINEILTYKEQVIYDVDYNIDSNGYRLTLPISDKNNQSIVFLGGSFVFGIGIEDAETLTSQMSLIDANRNYLNMGRGGYGPTHILGQVKTELDNILIFPPGALFIYHRFRGGHFERSWPTISWYKIFNLIIHYRWNEHEKSLDKVGPMFGDHKIFLAYLYDFLLSSWFFESGIFNYEYIFADEMIEKECRVIKEISRILREKSYRFILAEHPLHYEYPSARFENADKIFRDCIGNEFPIWTFQDLVQEAKINKKKFVVHPEHENHPNAQLNRLYAQELLKKINSL